MNRECMITEFTVNEPEKGKNYTKRIGAYGIVKNAANELGIIKTSTGYFLTGGGVEKGERILESLKREFVEETALIVDEIEQFAAGSYFFYSTTMNMDMESYGHFFKCNVTDTLDTTVETDHELLWISPENAIEKLYLENQKEAVRLYRERYL